MYPEGEPGVQKWKFWSRRRSTLGSANEDDNMRKPKSIPIRRTRVVRFDLSPSTIITIVLVVVGSWAMTRLLPAVLVLVGALVIPAVQWLEAHRLRRGLGISIVFIMLLVITLLVVTLTFPALLAQVTSLLEKEPALRARLVTSLAGSRLTAPFAETVRIMNYDALMKSFGATAFALSRRVLEVFAYSLASIFLGLYMMIDRDHLRGGLYAIVPRSQHLRLSRVMMNLETIVGGYIRGQLITCVLMTVFMFLLLVACGVPSALAIAVFGGVADVLPYIGIFLTMGPAVAAAVASPAFQASLTGAIDGARAEIVTGLPDAPLRGSKTACSSFAVA